ncbi:hypothetical protein NA56DRAFT_711126 [Hyaloscypha hepaticicola]|uniref:Uncharacterized protein n=1 Tax=Hyaloscypha hepaticicola TaxID=2082293 RepID=A0A2J6PJX1_9HELO|nr:hypothetical protein NA56DRAFT_711126 [Hyaloscypha hepaticicola]
MRRDCDESSGTTTVSLPHESPFVETQVIGIYPSLSGQKCNPSSASSKSRLRIPESRIQDPESRFPDPGYKNQESVREYSVLTIEIPNTVLHFLQRLLALDHGPIGRPVQCFPPLIPSANSRPATGQHTCPTPPSGSPSIDADSLSPFPPSAACKSYSFPSPSNRIALTSYCTLFKPRPLSGWVLVVSYSRQPTPAYANWRCLLATNHSPVLQVRKMRGGTAAMGKH